MGSQQQPRVGLSIFPGRPDLSDLPARLDEAEGFGIDTIELPTYDYDVVVGGRIRPEQLEHAAKRWNPAFRKTHATTKETGARCVSVETQRALARVKAACGGRSATFTAHGPLGINFFDPSWRCTRHWNVLAASLEVAAELACEHCVLHGGSMGVIQHDGLEDAYARQREWLVRAGDLARSLGVVVCVENLLAGYEGARHTATPERLARELAAIDHPFVLATLGFGHGHLNLAFQGGDLLAECAALAPLSRHLHMHDNFGRQDDIWAYTHGEKIAFGHGDLHLPVGWGDIPWDAMMERCVFPAGVIFNIELEERHWHEAGACIAATRALAARARVMAP